GAQLQAGRQRLRRQAGRFHGVRPRPARAGPVLGRHQPAAARHRVAPPADREGRVRVPFARRHRRRRVPVMAAIRVLLLEDSPLDAELILASLRAGGLEVDARRVDTREDFEQALGGCPDLILADYSLPGFDGISAMHLARERCPEVPFVFVTGALGEELAIETLRGGATDYVLKGRLERLVPAVRRALRESGERAERRRA